MKSGSSTSIETKQEDFSQHFTPFNGTEAKDAPPLADFLKQTESQKREFFTESSAQFSPGPGRHFDIGFCLTKNRALNQGRGVTLGEGSVKVSQRVLGHYVFQETEFGKADWNRFSKGWADNDDFLVAIYKGDVTNPKATCINSLHGTAVNGKARFEINTTKKGFNCLSVSLNPIHEGAYVAKGTCVQTVSVSKDVTAVQQSDVNMARLLASEEERKEMESVDDGCDSYVIFPKKQILVDHDGLVNEFNSLVSNFEDELAEMGELEKNYNLEEFKRQCQEWMKQLEAYANPSESKTTKDFKEPGVLGVEANKLLKAMAVQAEEVEKKVAHFSEIQKAHILNMGAQAAIINQCSSKKYISKDDIEVVKNAHEALVKNPALDAVRVEISKWTSLKNSFEEVYNNRNDLLSELQYEQKVLVQFNADFIKKQQDSKKIPDSEFTSLISTINTLISHADNAIKILEQEKSNRDQIVENIKTVKAQQSSDVDANNIVAFARAKYLRTEHEQGGVEPDDDIPFRSDWTRQDNYRSLAGSGLTSSSGNQFTYRSLSIPEGAQRSLCMPKSLSRDSKSESMVTLEASSTGQGGLARTKIYDWRCQYANPSELDKVNPYDIYESKPMVVVVKRFSFGKAPTHIPTEQSNFLEWSDRDWPEVDVDFGLSSHRRILNKRIMEDKDCKAQGLGPEQLLANTQTNSNRVGTLYNRSLRETVPTRKLDTTKVFNAIGKQAHVFNDSKARFSEFLSTLTESFVKPSQDTSKDVKDEKASSVTVTSTSSSASATVTATSSASSQSSHAGLFAPKQPVVQQQVQQQQEQVARPAGQ